MRVVSLKKMKNSSEPVGKEKFVTLLTLVMCVAYFLLAIIDQIISICSDIGFISHIKR